MKKMLLTSAVLAIAGVGLVAGNALAITMTNGYTTADTGYVEYDFGQAGTSSSLSFYGDGSLQEQLYLYDVYLEYTIGSSIYGSWLSDSAWSVSLQGSLGYTAASYVSDNGVEVQVTATLGQYSNFIEFDYNVVNGTGSSLDNVMLYAYMDPDLNGTSGNDNAATTSFSGETMLIAYEESDPVTSIGLVNGGTMSGVNIVGWEINEYSTLYDNIDNGGYTLTNTITGSNPFDVTMALQYDLGSIANTNNAWATTELVVNPVPEPATMLLFGTGLAGLAGVARRKRKNS